MFVSKGGQLKSGKKSATKAVLVCRICPIHLGHQRVIEIMVDRYGAENCIVVIGSANAPLTMRNFFSYVERRDFISKIFPDIKVVPHGDCPGDNAGWLQALDDILQLWVSNPKQNVVFFGGCKEDIEFFIEAGRNVEIVNRFDGTTPKISATEVRDALMYDRPLDGLVDPLIAEEVMRIFKLKWEKFKKM